MIVVGLTAIILIAFVGLAIDVGRMYAARAELSRAADAAALAGILELDGTAAGKAAAQTKALNFGLENEPTAAWQVTPDPTQNRLTVNATKNVKMYFLSLVGIDNADVKGHAASGFDTVPIDAVLVIDHTGSMAGTPINEAKKAAKDFVNVLVPASGGSGMTAVGVVPFRGCYNPPRSNSNCTPVATMLQGLTSSNATLTSKINAIQATGGSGTNVCLGLLKGGQTLLPPATGAHTGASTLRYVVLLSDGDNNYTGSVTYSAGESSPDTLCRPATNPSQNQSGGSCTTNDATQERELDELTYRRAQDLKAQGVEVFVVAFGVCSWNANTYCDASIWGLLSPAASPWTSNPLGSTAATDNNRDQNLLKCVASSTTGTNDHSYFANAATDLPAIFTKIAQKIAHRLTE
ncbi:MAG TPA: vWA domain-containing protein [Dehalococcoidia bacterium]|nr:vWA domain-containing protein [Dehalococcoidia bacterium]